MYKEQETPGFELELDFHKRNLSSQEFNRRLETRRARIFFSLEKLLTRIGVGYCLFCDSYFSFNPFRYGVIHQCGYIKLSKTK